MFSDLYACATRNLIFCSLNYICIQRHVSYLFSGTVWTSVTRSSNIFVSPTFLPCNLELLYERHSSRNNNYKYRSSVRVHNGRPGTFAYYFVSLIYIYIKHFCLNVLFNICRFCPQYICGSLTCHVLQ